MLFRSVSLHILNTGLPAISRTVIRPVYHVPIILQFAIIIFGSALLLIIGPMLVGNLEPLPQMDDELPAAYLPGKQSFPSDASCTPLHDGRFSCYVVIQGNQVSFGYSGLSQSIFYSYVATPHKTLGDLINAWGNPTGIAQADQNVLVFWNTRAAYLALCSFQISSPVNFVSYADNHSPVPWRGIDGVHYRCANKTP